MKLSFVIPAYNEEAYIEQCLSSIIKEKAGKEYDIEIIVVDNASTDNTGKIAESFEGVKVVREPQKGLVKARQAGFLVSNGDLIANVDADTMLTEGWIDKVLREFLKNEKLVALSGPFIYYDLTGFVNFLVQIFYYLGFLSHLLSSYIFRHGSVLQGGNFILRREALEKIGGYNHELTFFGEDADVGRRISKIGKVKFTRSLPIYSSGRRLKAEGVMTTAIRVSLDYLWINLRKKPYRKTLQRDIRP